VRRKADSGFRVHFHSPLLFLVFLAFARGVLAGDAAWEPNFRDRSQYLFGAFVYERNCVVCHGARGDGQGEMAASLIPRPRPFRSGVFKYRSTPTGKMPTNDDLMRVVRNGLSGTAMGMFKGLADDEVRAVVEYVKSFSPRWRERENFAPPMIVPARPEWWNDSTARRQQAAAGQALFGARCAVCHGESGDGRGPAASALRDVWNQPCPPADLRAFHRRNGDRPEDVFRTLLTGIDGTPMVSLAETLDDAQRWSLVAFVESLRAP